MPHIDDIDTIFKILNNHHTIRDNASIMNKTLPTRKIEIDEEVLRALHEKAEPWREQPNDVLRRLLNLPPLTAGRAAAKGVKRGEITTQAAFRVPLLSALVEIGGKAPAPKVIDLVGEKISLKPRDHDRLNTGDIRWRNSVAWERAKLVQEGLMKPSKRRGVWEISEQGRAYLLSQKGVA